LQEIKSSARAATSWLQADAAASFSQLRAKHCVVLPQRAHGAGEAGQVQVNGAAAQLVRYGRDASGGGQGWTAALVMLSLCASTYGFGWDVAMDWALVQSTDPGQLKPGAEGWYRAAVAADALLRLTWVATLTPAGGPGGAAALATALAALEVSRRCLWSFFRIENEHIANANHLQATQQVSLPAPHGEEEGAGGWTVTGLALGGVGRRGEAGASSAALEEAAAGRAQARQAPGEHFNWADADEEGEGGG
jgi:hypothetical protein